ncbi:hypothetical protein MS2017_0679 [Bathymodiolus thermophilus thioautotrophic gill symbiont]|uniref:Uncharacterized protein n=1 Tax=Bathymodiolus thermophilus thioautotrophic gill symbiont TaxID=2360 RepID=A0A3G3IKN5_9GAMM|nr:hypothetical protein MS2017_0679 [Bathymodiolus thermophilus thioautotrophic gill symbiont]
MPDCLVYFLKMVLVNMSNAGGFPMDESRCLMIIHIYIYIKVLVYSIILGRKKTTPKSGFFTFQKLVKRYIHQKCYC